MYPHSLPCSSKLCFPYQGPTHTKNLDCLLYHPNAALPPGDLSPCKCYTLTSQTSLSRFQGCSWQSHWIAQEDPLLPLCLHNMPRPINPLGMSSAAPRSLCDTLDFLMPQVNMEPSKLNPRMPLLSLTLWSQHCQKSQVCWSGSSHAGWQQASLNSKWLAAGPAGNDVSAQGPWSRGAGRGHSLQQSECLHKPGHFCPIKGKNRSLLS